MGSSFWLCRQSSELPKKASPKSSRKGGRLPLPLPIQASATNAKPALTPWCGSVEFAEGVGSGGTRRVYRGSVHFSNQSPISKHELGASPLLVAIQVLHLLALRRSRVPFFGPGWMQLESELDVLRREHALSDVIEAGPDAPGKHLIRKRIGSFLIAESVVVALYEWGERTLMTPDDHGRYSASSTELVLFTEEGSRDIIRQLLLAVQYLHSVGVVHRDIKPQNILLSGDFSQATKSYAVPFWASSDDSFEDDFMWEGAEILDTVHEGLSRHADVLPFVHSLFDCWMESEQTTMLDEALLKAAINERRLSTEKMNCSMESMDNKVPDSRISRRILLSDFNSARLLHPDHRDKGGNGTRAFTAPESFVEVSESINPEKREVWAIGCTLVTMLRGAPPYNDDNHTRLLYSILSDAVQLPAVAPDHNLCDLLANDASSVAQLSQNCITFLRGLLAKDPESRWTVSEALASSWLKDDPL